MARRTTNSISDIEHPCRVACSTFQAFHRKSTHYLYKDVRARARLDCVAYLTSPPFPSAHITYSGTSRTRSATASEARVNLPVSFKFTGPGKPESKTHRLLVMIPALVDLCSSGILQTPETE